MIGTRLAHYEITEKLGQGGMGEVYRARDTKLGREVALKIVSAEFAADPERMARFEREARTLAALQHANVASLHGFEESGGVRFLVMELVDGEELAERMARGPLPIDDAKEIALQIAEGLEAAHRKGIVHRDLKPANVKLSSDGQTKILDFGLARAIEDAPADAGDIATSPTITAAFTQQGVILGTAAYMSPEQARGAAVDERGDIWAFGVILFEMLSGRRLFEGDTVSDTLAAVIRAEPDWDQLPPTTPPAMLRLLRRCLAKKPSARLQAIGDARLELTEEDVAASEIPARMGLRPSWLLLAAVLALATGLWFGRRLAPRLVVEVEEATHSALLLPEGWQIAGWGSPTVEFSADGKIVAYVASRGPEKRLFVHDLREPEPREVPDSDAAEGPFFSPDGSELAFANGRISGVGSGPGRLRSYSLATGKTRVICDLIDYFGGTWGEDGTIFFTGVLPGPLWKVDSGGGVAEPSAGDGSGGSERSMAWPQILPGGRHALVTLWKGELGGRAAIIDLESGELRDLGLDSTFSRWTKNGDLFLCYPNGRVFVSDFDLGSFETRSAPREILGGVTVSGNDAAVIAFSHAGDLIYSTGYVSGSRRDLSHLAWLEEDGTVSILEEIGLDLFKSVAISPDGRRVAVASGRSDLRILDLDRHTELKLPRGEVVDRRRLVWTPSGTEIVFSGMSAVGQGTSADLFLQPADGVQPPRQLVSRPGEYYAYSFVPDTRMVLHAGYASNTGDTRFEIFSLDMDGGNPETVFGEEESSVTGPELSPDGRWLAYFTRGSENAEIFLRSYPDLSRKIPLGQGRWPAWSRDGSKLYFARSKLRWTNSIWVRDTDLDGDEPKIGEARLLLESEIAIRDWDVHPDGRRVLLLLPDEESGIVQHFTLVQDWSRSRSSTGASR